MNKDFVDLLRSPVVNLQMIYVSSLEVTDESDLDPWTWDPPASLLHSWILTVASRPGGASSCIFSLEMAFSPTNVLLSGL